jgi:hypothetical protein
MNDQPRINIPLHTLNHPDNQWNRSKDKWHNPVTRRACAALLPCLVKSTDVSACKEVDARDGEDKAAKLVSEKKKEQKCKMIRISENFQERSNSLPQPEIRELVGPRVD